MEAKKKADAGDWFDRAMRALTPLILAYIATVGPQPAKELKPVPDPAPLPPPVVVPIDPPKPAIDLAPLLEQLKELRADIADIDERLETIAATKR